MPIIEGPMLDWLRWSMENTRPGQKKLFVWEDGRQFTERNFYKRWHAATKRAGVEGYVPHDSRRSANRNMRNENVQQGMRMKIMGHKTPSMDRRYGIVDFTDVVAAGKIMSAVASKTTPKTTVKCIWAFGLSYRCGWGDLNSHALASAGT